MFYKVLFKNGDLKRMAREREARMCAQYPHLIAGIWRDVDASKIVVIPGDKVKITVEK